MDPGVRCHGISTNETRHEKTNVLVSDQVTHKPDCTATEDGFRKKRDFPINVAKTKPLISFASKHCNGIVTKFADSITESEADLRLCFRICKTLVFT